MRADGGVNLAGPVFLKRNGLARVDPTLPTLARCGMMRGIHCRVFSVSIGTSEIRLHRQLSSTSGSAQVMVSDPCRVTLFAHHELSFL